MKIPEWKPGLTAEEERDVAYAERNLLALWYADGWYNDDQSAFPGWRRVLSLQYGSMCFHIPDDFDVGRLPEIKPNWNGHSTRDKWTRVMDAFKIKPE